MKIIKKNGMLFLEINTGDWPDWYHITKKEAKKLKKQLKKALLEKNDLEET